MAMRLYTREEFEDELREKWGLTLTDECLETARIWRTKSGNHVTVPLLPAGEAYPDYFLNEIERQLDSFDEHPFRGDLDSDAVTEPAPVDK